MAPLKRDMEMQLDAFKQDMLGQARDVSLSEVNSRMEGLTATNSAWSDAISQITKISSHTGSVLADISVYQNRNNTKIEELESTLIGIKQSLKTIQEESKHSDPNRAEIDLIKHSLESMQTRNEHADPKQTENIGKLSVVEANQTRMMEALALLQDENYIMWKEIMQTRKHTDPKRLESIKNVSPVDQNQPQMLELMSSIMSYNNSVRE